MRTIYRGRCVSSRESAYSPMSSACEPTAFCRDISGDAVFVSVVREYRDKPWVNQTIIPYTQSPDPSHPHPHPHSSARSLPLNVRRAARRSLMPGYLKHVTTRTQCRPSRLIVQIKILL